MPLEDNEFACRENDGSIVLRSTAMRVRWSLGDLMTADDHRLNCLFTCGVQALDQPLERRMLEEVFLSGRNTLNREDVVEHFASALRSAAAKAVSSLSITDALADAGKAQAVDAVKRAAESVAFACGLAVVAPLALEVNSPSFDQQKLESMQRRLAETRAAGQLEHLQRAAELLKQFESIRAASPQLSAGAVLEQLAPADRGAMLQSLLMASAKSGAPSRLWVAAGQSLVRVDPHAQPMPKVECIPLPPTLGPLRSVQPAEIEGKTVLLLGARSGVMLLGADDPSSDAQLYADPEIVSALGFSRAVAWNGGIWACHSEAGLAGWTRGETSSPTRVIRSDRAPAARHLYVLDERRLIFASGNRLMTMHRAGEINAIDPLGGGRGLSTIVGIVPDDAFINVACEAGEILRLDRLSLQLVSEQRRGARLTAAASLPWLDGNRLLLATEEGPIDCIAFDDPLVTEYASPHRGVRVLAAARDLVAAASADRQRLVLWNSWDGRKPFAEVHVAGVARHRIADIDFG